ncbi:hypothetical protein ACGYK4_17040 [Sulfitobacter sp. 1A13368]|uniref:hypothetical protein n=1 Tax=Sulfitobacter sp. 1A13368 TaxID=3368593 RepID=UPI0037466C3C
MKTLNISQFSAHEHAEPSSPQELLEAMLAGCDIEENNIAASQIDDAVQDLLTEDESIEEFWAYNEKDEEFYRIGDEICVYGLTTGNLHCGSADEHAASDVADFREYISEQDDDLNTGNPASAM